MKSDRLAGDVLLQPLPIIRGRVSAFTAAGAKTAAGIEPGFDGMVPAQDARTLFKERPEFR
jgi:hypothetical protein